MLTLKQSALCVTMLAALGMTACQTNPTGDYPNHRGESTGHGWNSWKKDGNRMRDPKRFEEMKKRHEALNQACAGKAGQTISVTVDDKTIQGTCETVFQPDRGEMPKKPMP